METIGVIGGSGLYDLPDMEKVESVQVKTPFGAPSDRYLTGSLHGAKVIFLPRHGRGHRLLPTELNSRANIWGFKALGATRLLSVTAVGSLQEGFAPGDLVLVDQFIDRTRARASSFFGSGVVAHVSMAEPTCGQVRGLMAQAAGGMTQLHPSGTYLCMEGPQFSTRAESQLYRSWGLHVIGMTNMPEAKLAREAELCYAPLALVTDYDCWRLSDEPVSVEQVVAQLGANVARARSLISAAIPLLASTPRTCSCPSALAGAIMTSAEAIPPAARKRLALLLGDRVPSALRKAGRKTLRARARRT